MINGMVKLVLAKMSIGAVTNWIGLSSGADEGMNLLQTIIYTVLSWDIRELESRASKLEKSKDIPSKDQISAVMAYTKLSREEQEALREISKISSVSIIHAILTSSPSNPSTTLTNERHRFLLEYLSIQLSIRDREQIINVLCKSNPDNLTVAVRDIVTIYDPIIRNLHIAVDLSGTVSDFERFINDMIKTAKINDSAKQSASASSAPGVEEFVALFERHQKSCHVFLHQFCKNGAKATELWRDYAKYAVKQFRQPEDTSTEGGAGGFDDTLSKLVNELGEEDRKTITPSVAAGGKVRSGKDTDVKTASGVDLTSDKKQVSSTKLKMDGAAAMSNGDVKETVVMPDVRRTVELLQPRFKEVLAGGH
ncbi:hypothetical protein ABW21_db0202603 [Orbilia brochopaga]|nr:hypothetical protein ABW21_db0202603 [Drechslerella brochopaga]